MQWLQPIRVVHWHDAVENLRLVRTVVFILEQHVPEVMEWDEFDAISLHALACDDDKQPIGTARLLPNGHIGRMAVLKQWRNRGIGSAMLQELLKESVKRGSTQAMLSAQAKAVGFYEKFGFKTNGEVFMEAGIPHVEMILTLNQN